MCSRPTRSGRSATSRIASAERFSATYQVAVAARTIREVAELATRARAAGKRVTTLTLDTAVRFATPAARQAFANELVNAITALVASTTTRPRPSGRTYRLFLGAHPEVRGAEDPARRTP